jgi:polysaccharide biosynthesis protein PslG
LGSRRRPSGRTIAGRITIYVLVAGLTLAAGSSAALAASEKPMTPAAASWPVERVGALMRAMVENLRGRPRPPRVPHRVATPALSGLPGTAAVRPATAPTRQVNAARAYEGRVGASSHTIWYRSAAQLASLRRARRSGLTWVREDFAWGAFERRPGVWDWSVGDTFMRNLSRAGLDVLPVIAYSPGWAASGPTIYHPPRYFGAYANFCKQLVRRYGVGGRFWAENPGLAPRPLRAMEIWNEPWHEFFWRPLPDPDAYARLVRASAQAVRSVDPDVKILASADIFQYVTGKTLDWFKPLLKADPALFRDLVDAYSVHLYVQSRSPRDRVTAQRWRFDRALLTRDLAAQAGASHPLWVTEFGWSTFAGDRDSVSEKLQARYVREALKVAHVEWNGLVERSFVYFWGKATADYGGGFGILRPDGTAKPLFGALRALLEP